MVSPAQAGLEIAQHCVEPEEFKHFLGFAATDNDRRVLATRLSHGGKAGQAIRQDDATGRQVIFRKGAYSLAGEARYRGHLDV